MDETPRECRRGVSGRGALIVGATLGGGSIGGWLATSGDRTAEPAGQGLGSAGGVLTDAQLFVGGRVTAAGAVLNDGGDRYLDRMGGVLPDRPLGAPRFVCPSRGPLHVRYFGAVGDGSTDDTEAFRAAYRAAVDKQQPGFEGNDRAGRTSIHIPEGRFVLTGADAMMAATGGPRCDGLQYEGAGAGISELVFAP